MFSISGIVCVLQALVNFLLLLAFYTDNQLRRNKNLLLLIYMAFIDFLYSIVEIPYLIYIIHGWIPNGKDFVKC